MLVISFFGFSFNFLRAREESITTVYKGLSKQEPFDKSTFHKQMFLQRADFFSSARESII
jgi:hypothetical protein